MNFAALVEDLDYGRVNTRLGEELKQLSAAVDDTGNQGTMVVTLKVTKEGKHAKIDVASKLTVPKEGLHGTLFHFGPKGDGTLTRDDPRQMNLLELPGQKPAEFDPKTGEVIEND